ncbi:MAG: DNA-binding protein [Candidatus Liptonbacteria bacterium]|nr:DNA-binding protein [Candidatus Liptonbacteria bacterium]
MRQITQDKNIFILRFDRGEEILTGLVSFARNLNIRAGTFEGLGAAEKVTLSFYDFEKKMYFDKEFREVEIASLTGNVGILKGEIAVHAHGVFSGKDLLGHAGHIKELVVSGTGEIRFEVVEGVLERTPDPETGLNLLQ